MRDVTAFSRVHGAQFYASVTCGAAHCTDVLVSDAVVGADWHVEGRTRPWTDTDSSITHAAVGAVDAGTHF